MKCIVTLTVFVVDSTTSPIEDGQNTVVSGSARILAVSSAEIYGCKYARRSALAMPTGVGPAVGTWW